MKKSFISALAVFGGLAGIAIGFAAGRPALRRVSEPVSETAPASESRQPVRKASLAKTSSRFVSGDSDETASELAKSQDGEAPIIRFANNPQPVPPFLVTDLDGRPVSTAAWKGKVVFINFWATWCPPCRAEIPVLIDLANRYKDVLQIVGVSLDDGDPAEVKNFATHMGINYPIVMASREIVKEYGGVPALPTLFVVNTDGKVVQKHEGLYSRGLYETELRLLLDLPTDAKIETFDDHGQIFLKNATLATELPGVDFSDLSPEKRKAALKRLNSQTCDCGCSLTLAQCRINDTSCPVSKKLAAAVVKEVAANTSQTLALPPVSDQK
jgi:cytochrome c biogenesis protein CcmG/thiol:disulfide interchange protein DsbE